MGVDTQQPAGSPASSPASSKGRLTLALLGGALLVLLLCMSAFNAFNLTPAPPYHGSPFALFLFTGITVVLFLLLLLLLILLARNILKMYGDGRSRVLGSRLRSRMLLGALLLSFAPIVFMALFSFLLMNRTLDRWFSQPVARLRDQSLEVALQLSRYVTGNARAEAESLARSPGLIEGYNSGVPEALSGEIRKHRITLEGGFVFVYRDGQPVSSYQVPAAPPPPLVHTWPQLAQLDFTRPDLGRPDLARPDGLPAETETARRARPRLPTSPPTGSFSSAQATLAAAVLKGAENADGPVLSLGQGNDYALGASSFDDGGVVVVALPLPSGLAGTMGSIAAGAQEYWAVYRERRTVRSTFLLLLTLVTTLTFFASSWLALFLSKQITRPVEALADAMNAIAEGDYGQRIAFSATEELSELIGSFNQMATDLEESRLIADSSTAQIEQANRTLKERQHELELILETIPSGVVVLDGARAVLQVNRAFLDLLTVSLPAHAELLAREPGHPVPRGMRLEDLLPAEILEEVLRLERRAQRMGVAGVELELAAHPAGAAPNGLSPTGPFPAAAGAARPPEHASSLSVTIAVLNLGPDPQGHQRRGSVLVVDDVSDVLQAQRQVAWKEVAQRVAHEIKNPLTPIALSAERILRHLDRASDRTDDRIGLGLGPGPLDHERSGERPGSDRNGSDRNGLDQPDKTDSPAVIRKCSQVILASVESMRLLVDQFAALAEFPAAQPRAASLNDIAENALLLFHGRLENIRIETRFSPALPPVLADPEALKRALANLIDNAAEAMNSSFHRVLRLETSLSERTGMAELLVADTGPGLSPEVRERLFLPYFSTKQRGTGLGLAIAAKIVQDHHGTIRAEQRGASGACFVIELPLARAFEPAAESVPA